MQRDIKITDQQLKNSMLAHAIREPDCAKFMAYIFNNVPFPRVSDLESNPNKKSPLLIATELNKPEALSVVSQLFYDGQIPEKEMRLCLCQALIHNCLNAFDYLANKASIRTLNASQAIYEASSVEKLNHCLNHDANINLNLHSKNLMTPVHYFIEKNNIEVAKLLRREGAVFTPDCVLQIHVSGIDLGECAPNKQEWITARPLIVTYNRMKKMKNFYHQCLRREITRIQSWNQKKFLLLEFKKMRERC